jgi:hypothetical protein
MNEGKVEEVDGLGGYDSEEYYKVTERAQVGCRYASICQNHRAGICQHRVWLLNRMHVCATADK